MTIKMSSAILLMLLLTLACFNRNNPQSNILADNRFEGATASSVLGARQLLVDTSNGDVWMLDGDRAPDAQWVLLTRGPEDAREPEPPEIPVPGAPSPPDE